MDRIIQTLRHWWVEPPLLLMRRQFGICKHSSCSSMIFLTGGGRGIIQPFLEKTIKWSIVHKRNSSGLQNKHPFHQIFFSCNWAKVKLIFRIWKRKKTNQCLCSGLQCLQTPNHPLSYSTWWEVEKPEEFPWPFSGAGYSILILAIYNFLWMLMFPMDTHNRKKKYTCNLKERL